MCSEKGMSLGQVLDEMGFTERHQLTRLLADEVIYRDGTATMKTVIPSDDGQLRPTAVDSERAGV